MTPSIESAAFAFQLASTFAMTGVIWVIQLTHYPGFAQIERSRFSRFHAEHCRSLGLIAAPAMTAELLTALWIARAGGGWPLLNLGSVIVLWGLTFLVSVPAHGRLAGGFDEAAWSRLVRTNWLRTALWSLRSSGWLVFLLIFGARVP